MRQHILAMSISSRNEIFLSTFESQYLVGAVSPQPLDQQRLFRACGGASDRCGAHPHAGKARAQRIAAPPRNLRAVKAHMGEGRRPHQTGDPD
jgi:hypothetical protein